MRQARTAIGQEKQPKKEDIQREYDDVAPQEQENVLAKEEKKLQEADKAKQRFETPPRRNKPNLANPFQ